MDDTDMIYINEYLSFDTERGWFGLSRDAQEILYRKKQIICSYSGCMEWGHEFFCELLNLYSGTSKYNYSLGTIDYKAGIAREYERGHKEEVAEWIIKHKDDEWFVKAADMLKNIIDDVPRY